MISKTERETLMTNPTAELIDLGLIEGLRVVQKNFEPLVITGPDPLLCQILAKLDVDARKFPDRLEIHSHISVSNLTTLIRGALL